MARVTVEDCVLSVPNRFELCLVASKRARNIISGASSELEGTGEKPTVLALREIGENLIDIDNVKEGILTAIKNRNSSFVDDNQQNGDQNEGGNESSAQESSMQGQGGANFVSENIEVED